MNGALKEEIKAIHAWTPKCYTEEEWAKVQAKGETVVVPGRETNGEVVTGTRD